MLVIRMQRTGRKGHAQFRIVVQDSRRTPTSGKVVAMLGSYDPHAKTTTLNKEKASTYLNNGAQPSDRVARLLQAEGVKLPTWVKLAAAKSGAIRNPEKLRRNQPKEETPKEEAPTEAAPATEEVAAEAEPPADAPEAETGTTES
jgi:small subunit ribosomal protein S16